MMAVFAKYGTINEYLLRILLYRMSVHKIYCFMRQGNLTERKGIYEVYENAWVW